MNYVSLHLVYMKLLHGLVGVKSERVKKRVARLSLPDFFFPLSFPLLKKSERVAG